jgi:hypothetical protein
MMGHREKLKNGDEYDTFTSWRKLVRLRTHKIKKLFARRIRRKGKQCVKGS